MAPAAGSKHDAHLYATPTQGRYAMSDAVVAVIVGPMGEGKSLASVQSIFVHLDRCRAALTKMGIPLKVAIVRDTHENIKRSIVPLFNEFFGANPSIKHQWKNDHKQLVIKTKPAIDIDLFGIDDLSAVSKIQGAAYGLIWIDDPVPYTDSVRTNAGILEDTFNACLVRCARQAGMRDGLVPRLQISTNLPDDDHWFNSRIMEPPDGPLDPRTPLITKEVFHIPYGENIFLAEISRQATIAAYAHDEVAYQRFVLGQIATRYPGKQVARNFNLRFHVGEQELIPENNWDSWMGFDSWGNPAAVLGQMSPAGRILVLDVLQGAQDIRALVENMVKPLIESPRWKDKARTWRYIGDFTMLQRDQSNVEESAAGVIEEFFREAGGHAIYFEAGPSTWDHIRHGLYSALAHTVNGEIGVEICPYNCRALIAGLSGRWHYPVNKTGARSSNKPVKSDASHCCDAFANAVCVLSAWSPPNRYGKKTQQARRARQVSRAKSYATG